VFSKFSIRVGSHAASVVTETLISHSFWLEEEKDFRTITTVGE